MRALHWFRSDLRVADNTPLGVAASHADHVIPLFIIDPRLLQTPTEHPRAAFMIAALRALRHDLDRAGSRLVVLTGKPEDLLPHLCETLNVDLVTWARDYTPFAKKRDGTVEAKLTQRGIRIASIKDRVVFESGEVRKADGGVFRVFTPFKRRWRETWQTQGLSSPAAVTLPPCPPLDELETVDIDTLNVQTAIALPQADTDTATLRLGTFLDGPVRAYKTDRDRPAIDGTSRLSPYLRFGIISVRTCLRAAEEAKAESPQSAEGIDTWVDELIWREFYHAILDTFPHVAGGAFKKEYDHIAWGNDERWYQAWCDGQTGYPMVDAAMRQLNQTGWMHNRARMVVASFLTKDLLIDWRWGERYFMTKLIDGDPASNNGGWQWSAGTGTDAQPYFRIFNPVRQGENFDPDGTYVKTWVPELRDVPSKLIHHPRLELDPIGDYPLPIVNRKERRVIAIERYKQSLKN